MLVKMKFAELKRGCFFQRCPYKEGVSRISLRFRKIKKQLWKHGNVINCKKSEGSMWRYLWMEPETLIWAYEHDKIPREGKSIWVIWDNKVFITRQSYGQFRESHNIPDDTITPWGEIVPGGELAGLSGWLK